MAQDPVCKMQVEEKKAAAKVEHMGKTCYFCSEGCRRAFEKDPHKYVEH